MYVHKYASPDEKQQGERAGRAAGDHQFDHFVGLQRFRNNLSNGYPAFPACFPTREGHGVLVLDILFKFPITETNFGHPWGDTNDLEASIACSESFKFDIINLLSLIDGTQLEQNLSVNR